MRLSRRLSRLGCTVDVATSLIKEPLALNLVVAPALGLIRGLPALNGVEKVSANDCRTVRCEVVKRTKGMQRDVLLANRAVLIEKGVALRGFGLDTSDDSKANISLAVALGILSPIDALSLNASIGGVQRDRDRLAECFLGIDGSRGEASLAARRRRSLLANRGTPSSSALSRPHRGALARDQTGGRFSTGSQRCYRLWRNGTPNSCASASAVSPSATLLNACGQCSVSILAIPK